MQRAYTFPRSISFCFTCAHAATYEVNIQRAFCPIIISLLTGKFQKRLPRLALCRFVTLPLTCKTPTQATCQLASYTCTSFSRIMCLDEPIHPCFRRYSSFYSRLVVDQPAVITQRLISSVHFSVSSFLVFAMFSLLPCNILYFPMFVYMFLHPTCSKICYMMQYVFLYFSCMFHTVHYMSNMLYGYLAPPTTPKPLDNHKQTLKTHERLQFHPQLPTAPTNTTNTDKQ